MDGLNKILSRITDDSKIKVDEILAKAKAEANEITLSMKEKVKNECDEITKKTEKEKANILERAEGSKEHKQKQVKLVARREALDEILVSAREKLNTLSEKEYSELLIRAFDKYATKNDDTEVKLCFGKDKGKISKETKDMLLKKATEKGIKMTLSDKEVNIANGFMLDYGDILENCSFDAMIDQNKEVLEDKINKILF